MRSYRLILGAHEVEQIVHELGDVSKERLLGLAQRPGLEVHHAGALAQLDDLVVVRVVTAREHVHVVPFGRELSRHLQHVDVHAAGVLLAETRHRTPVKAQGRQVYH